MMRWMHDRLYMAALVAASLLSTPLMALSGDSQGESILMEVQSILREPVVIERINGSRFSGQFGGLIEDGFVMVQSVGVDGQVEVEFQWKDIESVSFGEASVWADVEDLFEVGDMESVIAVMSPLYLQRSPFFRLLPDEELKPYQMMAKAYLRLDQSTEALGVIRSVGSWIHDPSVKGEMEDTELLCYLMLALDEEAFELGRNKIEHARDPGSVSLAWVALGLRSLNLGHYREAWLCATHPMMFDRDLDSMELSDAYLIAMLSTLRLNQPETARRYHQAFNNHQLKLTEKPYQRRWVEIFNQIDWDELECQSDVMPRISDMESSIRVEQGIQPLTVPVANIPITE